MGTRLDKITKGNIMKVYMGIISIWGILVSPKYFSLDNSDSLSQIPFYLGDRPYRISLVIIKDIDQF